MRNVLQSSVASDNHDHPTYTERFRSSFIAFISIFLLPMLTFGASVEPVFETDLGGVVDSIGLLGA